MISSENRTRVLIVEDDPVMQDLLASMLQFEGFDTVVAGDGLAALDVLTTMDVSPAVILLDLMMPRMDGYAFAEERRTRGLAPGVPVIVLTADGRAEQKAVTLGAQGGLAKPFEVDQLLATIDSVISSE